MGTFVHIHNANYGRSSRSVCPHESTRRLRHACSRASFREVAAICNKRTSCRLVASSGVFGDPCVGTYKYLWVKYSCVTAGNYYRITICLFNYFGLICNFRANFTPSFPVLFQYCRSVFLWYQPRFVSTHGTI